MKSNEDIALQRCEILQMFVWRLPSLFPLNIPKPIKFSLDSKYHFQTWVRLLILNQSFIFTEGDESDMLLLSVVLTLLFTKQTSAGARCNAFSGPSGTTACVKFRAYNLHQWATCATDAYVKQQSHYKHSCSKSSSTYCWYQCMLEKRNKASGFVTIDCSCTLSPATTISPTATLSSACYSPSGSDCNWFTNCLKKKYPCKGSSTAYAVTYARIFCAVYEAHHSTYSSTGQNWMNSARKCLQSSLVPLLRPWVKPTCQDIRRKALNSHTSCFLKPDNQTSICNLNCNDYFKIFWTIRESFVGGLDTAWESIRAMWNVGIDCGAQNISQCFEQAIKRNMWIVKIRISRFDNRSIAFPYGDARNRLVDKIGASIAKSLNWNTKFIGWLAFPAEESSFASGSLDIILAVVDKPALGIVHAVLLYVDFDYIFNKFAWNMKRGTLSLTAVDGIRYWVKSLDICSDKACITTTPLAIAKRPNYDDDKIHRNIATALLPKIATLNGLASAAAVILLNFAAY